MFNTFQLWGLLVGNLLKPASISCQNLSTMTVYFHTQPTATGGNIRVISKLSEVFRVSFAHTIQLIYYLLHPQVIHISTEPITTTNKKGLKK